MKKLPLSNKALNSMFATALIVPFALVGTPSVSAETEQEIQDYAERMVEVYDEMDEGQKDTIREFREEIKKLDAETWEDDILPEDFVDAVEGKESVSRPVGEIAKDYAELLYDVEADKDQLISKIEEFRDRHDDSFKELFDGYGEEVTVAYLLGMASDLEEKAESLWVEGMDEEWVRDNIDLELLLNVTDDYDDMIEHLEDELDLSVSEISDISDDLIAEVGFNEDEIKDAMAHVLVTAFQPADDGSSGGGGGGSSSPSDSDDTTDEQEGTVSGDDSISTESETLEDGTEQVTATVDAESLSEALEEAASDDEPIEQVDFSIDTEAGEQAQLSLPSDAIETIRSANENATVGVSSNDGAFRASVSEFSADIAEAAEVQVLDTDEEDVSFSITMSQSDDENDVAEQNELTTASEPVTFQVQAEIGDDTINLDQFDTVVERDIYGEDDFDEETATAVRLEEDGTFTAVPTTIDEDTATLKGFSNSEYVVVENEASFPDVSTSDWALENIEKLASKYIIEGYNDNTFKPESNMTRAELATVLTRSLGLATTETYNEQFTDVDGSEWFVDEIMPAVETGIIEGHANGTFTPNEDVTREEAATMISRAIDYIAHEPELDEDLQLTDYTDHTDIADYADEHIETLIQTEIMNGDDHNQLLPKDNTTRAEMAALIDRFLQEVDFIN
ncbi:S-layer homology domain-containing protein [Texcoconibacillus texcoconensis]|uniref:SLH domain-containing protein n=1 Tax=Texcoconibacillus texcoconensis TaxID=1095777 RepID=A0A840QT82_9BACI|nr:S-layer homology domain-containing protein [Texcoconibacillus texcoconensis]MBB5174575.1 hypothetical protein [Texcoconibacillus texcoconensis]